MDPKDFYLLAKELSVQKNDPASMRTATSRAYYAIFNLAFDVLNILGAKILENPMAHKDVIKNLRNSGNIKAQKAGGQIDNLYTMRLDADYLMRTPKTKIEDQATTIFWVEQAGLIITFLESCKSEPLKSEIIAGIKTYQKKIEPK